MRPTQLKEKTLYRGLVRGAWEITWHKRELWPLGLLAALLMMNGGAFEFITRACLKIASGEPYSGAVYYGQAMMSVITNGDAVSQASLFFTLVLAVALFAAIALLAVAGGGALLKAAAGLAFKKKISARAALAAGMEKLGPLLLTQVVGRLTIFAGFVLAALGAYTIAGSFWGDLVAIGLFVVFSLVALVVSFLMMMTDAGLMIGNERWIEAAHNACRFLRRHWLLSLEMIGFIFLLAVAVAVLTVVGIIILIVPFLLIFLAISSLGALTAAASVAFVYELVVLLGIALIGAMLAVFERAAWGLLYIRLADRGALPKLERLWHLARTKLHARFNR